MTTNNSNRANKNSTTENSTKKSKADLAEQYLQILVHTDNGMNSADNVAAEKVLASLNSLADSYTGNPISIDSKKEILDLMKKRAQQVKQEQEQMQDAQDAQNANAGLLVVMEIIDTLKHRIVTDFQEQYQRYYGQEIQQNQQNHENHTLSL